MARRRYRRYRRRYGRWSPNIQEFPTTTQNAPANSTFWNSYVLAFNPIQTITSVSQTYTVKRLELNFYIDAASGSTAASSLEDITAYIMYVPQGMTVGEDYNIQHPEYIMAYKYLGGPGPDAGQPYQPTRITTRLSRKLHTGDSVVLYLKGNNPTSTAYSFDWHGLFRWWTKAN